MALLTSAVTINIPNPETPAIEHFSIDRLSRKHEIPTEIITFEEVLYHMYHPSRRELAIGVLSGNPW